mgnify:CR=1 FL=1
MRIHVSLLAFCVALAGCKSSVDSANIDSVVVSSNPTAAAVRINGEAVGRTPTTIKLDRTKNYELQVGKGGYLTETSELKPRLITTSEGIEFGFPAAVKVNLTKTPAAGEAGVPVADNPEFKKLSKKALGEEAAAKESLQSDIAATKEAATKIQAALAAREAATQARLAEISKSLADAKASKGKDESAKAKLAEAELALAQATADAEAARADAEKNLKTVEARRAALAGSETKVAQAKAGVVKAKSAALTGDDRLGKLEQNYSSEMKALKDSQANAAIAIKALSARADELNRVATQDPKGKQSDDARKLVEANKALEAQKAANAKANEALAKAKADAAKNSTAAAEKRLRAGLHRDRRVRARDRDLRSRRVHDDRLVQDEFDRLTEPRERERLALLVIGLERPAIDAAAERNPLALTRGVFDREQLILGQYAMEERQVALGAVRSGRGGGGGGRHRGGRGRRQRGFAGLGDRFERERAVVIHLRGDREDHALFGRAHADGRLLTIDRDDRRLGVDLRFAVLVRARERRLHLQVGRHGVIGREGRRDQQDGEE